MISQAIRGCYLKLLTNYFRNSSTTISFLFPDSTSLADAFNNLFVSKIDNIHNAFTEKAPENDRPLCDVQIHNFQQVTLDIVKKFAVKTLAKSCDLDPLPASVLKTCFPIILSTLISIINMSLKNGVMPYALKVAVLKPLLK